MDPEKEDFLRRIVKAGNMAALVPPIEGNNAFCGGFHFVAVKYGVPEGGSEVAWELLSETGDPIGIQFGTKHVGG